MIDERIRVDHALHSVPASTEGERCRVCNKAAAHKVEETTGPDNFHPLTAYLCCECFQATVGYNCATYPYGDPAS